MEEQPSPDLTVYRCVHPATVPLTAGPIETEVDEAGRETVVELEIDDVPLRLGELLTAAGSNTNPYPFTLLQADINNAKGALAAGNNPVKEKSIANSLRLARNGVKASPSHLGRLFGALRNIDSMFIYVNDAQVVARKIVVYQTIRAELILIGNNLLGPNHNLHLRWDEFMNDAYIAMQSRAQSWARDILNRIEVLYDNHSLEGTAGWSDQEIGLAIIFWRNEVARWAYPAPPFPRPPAPQ